MPTPWNTNMLGRLRDFIRFCVWMCLAVNSLMISVFSICWMYRFLTHLWHYSLRSIFSSDW